jgi:hypothetical protein
LGQAPPFAHALQVSRANLDLHGAMLSDLRVFVDYRKGRVALEGVAAPSQTVFLSGPPHSHIAR